MRSRSSLIAPSPSKRRFCLATFQGGGGSRGRRTGGGLRSGGRAFTGRGSLRGLALPRAGSGAASRAHFGAYFNGPGDSGSRSRVLILPLQRYALGLRFRIHSKPEPAAFAATAHPLIEQNRAPAGRFPSRTVDTGPTSRGAMEHAATS